MRYVIAIAAVLAFAAHAAAELVRPDSRGGLVAQVVVTNNAGKLQRMAGQADKSPVLRNAQTFRPRKTLHIAALMSGLLADTNGNYDASVTYRVFDPAKKTLVLEEAYAVATGKQIEPKAFVMAQPSLSFEVDHRAPKGPYFIEVEVLDKVAQRKAFSRQRVILQ